MEAWAGKGFTAKQIHSRLIRETRDYNDGQRFEGSVGAVKRFLARLRRKTPEAFVVIQYDPGKTAQVDFGTGPVLPHPKTGRPTRTHIFVLTLCYSYVTATLCERAA